MNLKEKVIAIDMDGVLSKEVCWTPKECLNATPNPKTIKWIEDNTEGAFIIIYTARRDFLIPSTLKWLRKHQVFFHAISNNKIPADVYIDDKAVHISDILKEV